MVPFNCVMVIGLWLVRAWRFVAESNIFVLMGAFAVIANNFVMDIS